jgi:hypothetical protein
MKNPIPTEWELKQLAKASVKQHKEFVYKQTNGQTRKVVI